MAKFNIGDNVIVVDNGELEEKQSKYIGSTGVVQDINELPMVLMDNDGKRIVFHESKLKGQINDAQTELRSFHD